MIFFHNTNTEVKKSDGEPATKKTKTDTSLSASNFTCHDCLGLRTSISQPQNDLVLETGECNELHSLLNWQKESF